MALASVTNAVTKSDEVTKHQLSHGRATVPRCT
jgi:hypothetical protein